MDGLFGDGLVDVLFCGGDSLEEDLRWGPRLGALVDFVEFEDGVTNDGVALFKIIDAFSRRAFFFSTSVELKTKSAGRGGAGREMMNSNTSLPAILTPKHFLVVSAIGFDRSDFACRQRVMVGRQILCTSVGPAWKHCLLAIGCLFLHSDWMMCLLPILL